MLFYCIYALAGFAAGVYLLFNVHILFFILTAAITISSAIFIYFRKSTVQVPVFCGFACLGYIIMLTHNIVSPYTDEYVTVTGRISEIPYFSNKSYCYTVTTDMLSYGGNHESFRERMYIYSQNEYKLDDTIQASGFLRLPSKAKNPGCFNPRLYYKSIGISYIMTPLDDKISNTLSVSNSPYAVFARFKNHVCNLIDQNFKQENAVVLKYILTNFRKDLSYDYKNLIIETGIGRCLYSPYFHLITILFIINCIFASIKKKHIMTCIGCIIYLVLNPYLPTGQKLFMFTLICTMLNYLEISFRKTDVLAAVVLLNGVKNPFILYNTGFIMSVCATLLVCIFYRKIYNFLYSINKKKMIRYIASLYIISGFIAMPLAAYLFNGVSLYSILISILLMPIMFIIYILSPFMFLAIKLFKNGFFLEYFIDTLVTFIRTLPFFIDKLPFSKSSLITPPVLLIAAFYCVIGALYNINNTKIRNVCFSCALGFTFAFGAGEIMRAGQLNITFLNVGQGDCTLTDIPYKCTILVDGGGAAEYNKNYDVGERDVLPYLRHSKISTIDHVFISHYHKDHADGIVSLIENIKIKNIFLPDCLPENEYRVIIEERAKKKNINLHYITAPEKIDLGDGAFAEVIYFDKNAKDENDTSVVMRITYDNISCLYTGDISQDTEKKLLDYDINANIIKVPHHGSSSSSSSDFVEKVSPEYAVIHVGENNNYGHPSKSVIQNYEKYNSQILRTDTKGCITFKMVPDSRRLIWQTH